MSEACRKLVRGLYSWEVKEFTPIFGNSLAYGRVRIYECYTWPDTIDRIGRWAKRMNPPAEDEHNALTLGNRCYFPVVLPSQLVPPGHAQAFKLDWLAHELTHVWQYQHSGWVYLWRAVRAQFKDKEQAYDYGGEEGLKKSMQKNKPFKAFNPEQQGNIVQQYYIRKRARLDTQVWEPYITQLKSL